MEHGKSHELAEVIAGLQAAQIAQSTLLQAIIHTHPDHRALVQRWNELSSVRAADALRSKASGAPGHITNHFLLEEFADWTRRLEEHAPGR